MNSFETEAHAALPLALKIGKMVKFFVKYRVPDQVLVKCISENDANKLKHDLLWAGVTEEEINDYVHFTWAY